jgi:UDP-glucose 4-epimerase
MKVLVTGGAGYIGSHTAVALAQAGHEPILLDNLSNASPVAVERVREVAGDPGIPFIEADVRDREQVRAVLDDHGADAVIHFAALKAVGESTERPLDYFDNNVGGTIQLLRAMAEARGGEGVGALVFSSSCTVYGDPAKVPVDEAAPTGAANPYGRTKLVMEELIGELCRHDPRFTAILLRYFNPAGAHPSGRMGEDPRGVPQNLVPYVAQVAVGRRDALRVFGTDWPTRDGTGVRDYIHVMDLAEAHVAAVEHLGAMEEGAVLPLNVGTGQGHSVLEVVRAFEKASGQPISRVLEGRRHGDIAQVWADPARAAAVLGWEATRSLEEMCADAWRWQRENPRGYEG